jgi:hypothetical protein
MYACVCEIGGGFFAGVYGSENRPVISCDHPALRCANWSVPAPYLGILGAADLYSTLQLGPGPCRMLDTDFAGFTISTPGE